MESSMSTSPRLFLVALLLSVLGAACRGERTASTPTRTSQEVIETAQANAERTREATLQTPPPATITPTATEILYTSTPSSTPTPSEAVATSDYNAYVREGPDESFNDIDLFLQGQEAKITGRYENLVNGTWWYIERLEGGKDGWVWGGAVTVAGDIEGIPYLISPPTSTPVEK
jgi:hypothetical protein